MIIVLLVLIQNGRLSLHNWCFCYWNYRLYLLNGRGRILDSYIDLHFLFLVKTLEKTIKYSILIYLWSDLDLFEHFIHVPSQLGRLYLRLVLGLKDLHAILNVLISPLEGLGGLTVLIQPCFGVFEGLHLFDLPLDEALNILLDSKDLLGHSISDNSDLEGILVLIGQ